MTAPDEKLAEAKVGLTAQQVATVIALIQGFLKANAYERLRAKDTSDAR